MKRRRFSSKGIHSNYLNTFEKATKGIDITRDNMKSEQLRKVVFNGVVAIVIMPLGEVETIEEVKELKEIVDKVKQALSCITPREIQDVFEIEKEYHGDMDKCKDYFYTKRYLETLDSDKPIGDNIENFIEHYYNWDLWKFLNISDEIEMIHKKALEVESFVKATEAIGQGLDKVDKEVKELYICIKKLDRKSLEFNNAINKHNKLIADRPKKISGIISWLREFWILRKEIKDAIKKYNQLIDVKEKIQINLDKANEEFLNIENIYELIETVGKYKRSTANELIIRLNQIKAVRESRIKEINNA